MLNPLAPLQALVGQLGRWNACLYVLNRMLNAMSFGKARIVKYYIVAQPVQAPAPSRTDSSTTIRLVDQDDDMVARFPRPPSVIARRYSTGSRCLAALVRDTFAGFLWWQHDRYEEDEVRCTYVLMDGDCCVWDYDVYVEPRFRLGRTLSRLWQRAHEELWPRGVRWTFSRISAFNPASLASHAKLGMQLQGSATFWLLGPLQVAFLSRSPYFHISLGPPQRPTLKLTAPAGPK